MVDLTTPKIQTVKRSGSRLYIHPDDRTKVPGVTSVVGMLPKGFLKFWGQKKVAEAAVEHLGEIVGIAMRDPKAAVDFLKGAPDRDTRAAAEIGSEAHDIFERLAKGERVGRLHPEIQPFADHFEAFLQQKQPEMIFMEETVWSEKHGYAGSFDVLLKLDGKTLIGDWKTTRSGVHEEVALQLSAYRYADYILRPDGGRVPMPEIDGAFVLHVRPEGARLVDVKADEETFGYFRHLREIYRYEHEYKSGVLLDAEEIKAPEKPKRRARRSA